MLALILLAGCLSRNFSDGKRLLDEGKQEEGIARLEQAVKDDPKNMEYRTTLVRQRELLLARHLAEGDALRAQGDGAGAERAYNKALALDAENPRVKAGVRGLQADVRLRQSLAQAAQALDKGDARAAETLLRSVLAENPNLPQAKALERRIIDRARTAGAGEPVLKPATTKPITLEFRDAPIKTVFEMISRTAGINFVFDKDVRPDIRVTIFVRDSNIEDAVKLLLVTNQLERKVLNENSVLIYPNSPAKIKEYQALVVRSFYLGNADAKQTQIMIKTLIRSSTVFIDEKLNLLIMRDTPEAVRMAEKLIAAQDLAEPEVMLELEVMEVKRSKLQELGIQYPNQFTVLNIVPSPQTVTTTGGVVVQSTDATTTTSQLTLNTLRGGPAAGQVGISPNPALNLKSESSDVNLLANPRIRVKNREKAKIHIGDKVPVITTTSTANVGVSQSVSYLDIGLKLDVEPNVQLDDEVSIRVGLEVSNIVREITNRQGVLTYQVGTRNAATALRLKNGETQVLAGLINDEDRYNASKIPGLGDIPLIGKLFSTNRTDKTKTEIVLLITPRIVRNLARPEFYAAEFSGGTDMAAGTPPLQIGATAPGALAMSSGSPAAGQGAAAAPLAPAAAGMIAPPPAQNSPPGATLSIAADATAKLDQDVGVAIVASPQLRAGQFDLVYDPAVLDGGPGGTPGRMTLKFTATENNAMGTVIKVRFKPLVTVPGDTQFRIENVTAQDGTGSALLVAAPPPQSVKLLP
ncbi:MAG: type secretory pathway, component HofQ [Betaproteobacteria bacterium]|nr:type secretory pathway, component HofQ [Betaproteobacteria bacterium]